MTVWFHAQTDAYAELSNFAPFGVEMDGAWWRTVEHAFQAAKFDDPAHRERILAAHRPKDAKALGLSRAVPIRGDWDEVRVEVMRGLVRAKFAIHDGPRAVLLGTGDEEIVESTQDLFWGGGPDGSGLNWLGRLLMETREALR
ncbi:NADAR family protein [Jannaschia sp. Os4]|uniref:NADAR family protein n=1 Tax=Jannaschia sp. Os4 TaxID=2807617 RepID=UPI001939FF9D|nr:NADAR family protein [Jannaschia sp. Os4]MBM2574837.1 NADAR family protein [Jannaschia sp. Os4]